jgi:hypothetical protein
MLAQNSFCIKSTGKYLPQYVNLKRGNKKQTKNGRTIWYLKKKKIDLMQQPEILVISNIYIIYISMLW